MARSLTAHLVLARKWRPERFSELVGQEHVTRTLARRSSAAGSRTRSCSPGSAASAKPRPREFSRDASIARRARPPSPAANAPRASRFAPARCARRQRDRRRDLPQDRRRARDYRKSELPARARPFQDLHHRRGASAHRPGLQRAAEDARGAAAARQVHPRDDRAAEDARDDPVAAAALRFPPHPVRDDLSNGCRTSPRARGVDAEEAALRLLAREAGGSMRDAERMLETAIASALEGQRQRGRSRVDRWASRAAADRVRNCRMRFSTQECGARARARCASCQSRGANLESLGRDLLETLRNLAVAKLPADDCAEPARRYSRSTRRGAQAAGRADARIAI